jgi:hypothetical protein
MGIMGLTGFGWGASGRLGCFGRNAGVLRYAQNDKQEPTTANAKAGPCGDDKQEKTTANATANATAKTTATATAEADPYG